MNSSASMLLIIATSQWSLGDAYVIAPTPGPIGGPTDTATFLPFLIKQITVSPFSSMRYQQVYNASVFTNVDRSLIYVTTLTFFLDDFGQGAFPWRVTSMQINLSTTQKTADGLSSVFAENVGADDTIVFGPGPHDFPLSSVHERLQILLDRPFRYNRVSGNLLLDVRIFDGTGPPDMNHPELNAYNSSMDEVSRVWATNVTAAAASGADTTGLDTVIQFSGVPSVQIQIESVYGTNRPVLRWPAQPSVFAPQTSPQLGSNAVWRTITGGILGTPGDPDRAIYLDTPPSGDSGFFRLIWESGQAAQPALISVPEARNPK